MAALPASVAELLAPYLEVIGALNERGRPLSDPTRLNGSGVILVNPPWTLENELATLLPALAALLGGAGKGGFRLGWLAGEAASRAG